MKNIGNLGFLIVIVLSLIIGFSLFKSSKVSVSEESLVPGLTPQTPVVVAQNLDTPWAIAFLPDKSMLITERSGAVKFIDAGGKFQKEPVGIIEKAKEIGEGGLLGIAIHPNFTGNNFIYFYYTYESIGDNTKNRVVRVTYQGNKLIDEKIIVDNIPGAANHNGGRIKFGPDGFLYITTGDAQNPSLAQNKNSLAGKILRVTEEGKPVADNPFNNLVYSYGHRNPQGLTWDGNGQLWSTEHGPQTKDEVNKIEKGKNYGWPTITGDEASVGMETAKLNSGSTTWAPAGLVFSQDSLFFGGLRGQTLFKVKINGDQLILAENLKGEFGRIRDVVAGPDDMLYITTSNRDGRGTPQDLDDRIIKVDPKTL